MSLKTSNPNKEISSVVYQYPNGDLKIIEFKNPLKIRESGWETEEDYSSETKEENKEDNISRSVRRAKNKIGHYCHSNDFSHFITLTIDPKRVVNRNDYGAMVQLLSQWIELQRKKNGRFKYIFIPELHKNGGIHFHGVIYDYKGKITKAKTRKGREVYHLTEWQHGYSDVEQIDNIGKVSNYIKKYITKDMVYIFGKKKYLVSKGLKVPQVFYDLDLTHLKQDLVYENNFSKTYYSTLDKS